MKRTPGRQLAVGLAFLLPNICGVLIFTVFPVLFAIMLAFTDWDLRKHNMFKDEALHFVGLENFVRLVTEAEFVRYLGNTLFLMMGMPLGIGGSLIAAMLLSKDPRGPTGLRGWVLATSVLVAAGVMLTALGMGQSATMIFLLGIASLVLVVGAGAGSTAYRTFFYAPHFTAGVATFLLWKKLFNPSTGPINTALKPVLQQFADLVNSLPATMVQGGQWVLIGLMVLITLAMVWKMLALWADGELSALALIPMSVLAIPWIVGTQWSFTRQPALWAAGIAAIGVAALVMRQVSRERPFASKPGEGMGSAILLCAAVTAVLFALLGLSAVMRELPAMASASLEPPKWIYDYHWSKPSLIMMGLWAAIGSNNMLLYLAALSNVPQELYEACDIDGASRWQRFWHVTWPQLAPTTFFIVVMGMIGGLQGGFEMARTMTRGGPDGATTTLSYFIYTEGFETGRLAFSAAVSWALFLLVFTITMFNWKFGNRYVND